MTFRQQSLWTEPAAGAVTKDGGGKFVKPDGKVSTRRGRSYTWLLCNVCGAGTWVGGLAPDQDRLGEPDYVKTRGRPCRTTPKCKGRHVVAEARP